MDSGLKESGHVSPPETRQEDGGLVSGRAGDIVEATYDGGLRLLLEDEVAVVVAFGVVPIESRVTGEDAVESRFQLH